MAAVVEGERHPLQRPEPQSSPVADHLSVSVPDGADVIVISDLHLRHTTSAVTARVEDVITARLRRIAATAGSCVVHIVGNHDGDLAWDDAAAAEVVDLTGAKLTLTAEL